MRGPSWNAQKYGIAHQNIKHIFTLKVIELKNLPFDTVAIDADEVKALEDTYKILKEKFSIALVDGDNRHLNKFELFNNDTGAKLGGTLFIDYPDCNSYLNFVKSTFTYSYGGRGGQGGQIAKYDKYQVWAFVNLNTDAGRVIIRAKTFADKVLRFFNTTELNFRDDRVFSDSFYVTANEPGKALKAITPDFRAALKEMMYKHFVIEIINDVLVIRDNQPVAPTDVVHLAELANKLAKVK